MGFVETALGGAVGAVLGGAAILIAQDAGWLDVVDEKRMSCPREDNDPLTSFPAPSEQTYVHFAGTDDGENGEVGFLICRDPVVSAVSEYWYFGHNSSRQTTLRPAFDDSLNGEYRTDSATFPTYWVDEDPPIFGFQTSADSPRLPNEFVPDGE